METKDTCVICAIIKNEHRYLKEWIDYHLALGFSHIYLFEDYNSKSHKEITDSYNKVTLWTVEKDTPVKNYFSPKTQIVLYQWFLREAKEKEYADWILYNDIDEFLCFEKGYNLEWFCKEFKNENGVYLCWKYYNANGHIKRPEGNVTDVYSQEATLEESFIERQAMWRLKSFVNVKNAKGLYNQHAVIDGVDVEHIKHYPDLKHSKVWLNHYFTKSWEDYVYRITSRGNLHNNFRTYDQFFDNNKDMIPLKEKLINEIRYTHSKSTMWLSRDLKIISGGNLDIINKLNKNNSKNV